MQSNKVLAIVFCVLPSLLCAAPDERPASTPSQAGTVGELLVLDAKQAVAAAKKALLADEEKKAPIPGPNMAIPNPSLMAAVPGAPFGGAREQMTKPSPMGDTQVDGVYQIKGDAGITTKVKVLNGGVSTLISVGSTFSGWRLARANPVDGCAVFERSEEVTVKRGKETPKGESDEPTIRIETRSAKLCVTDPSTSNSPSRGGGFGSITSIAPMPYPAGVANGTAMPVSSSVKP